MPVRTLQLSSRHWHVTSGGARRAHMSLVFTECPFLAQIPGQGSSFHLTVTPLGPRPGSAPGFPAPGSGPVRSHTCPGGRPSAASLTIALGFGVGEGDRPQKVPPSSRSVEAHTQQAATAGAGRRRLADRCSGAAAARPLPPRSARRGSLGSQPPAALVVWEGPCGWGVCRAPVGHLSWDFASKGNTDFRSVCRP